MACEQDSSFFLCFCWPSMHICSFPLSGQLSVTIWFLCSQLWPEFTSPENIIACHATACRTRPSRWLTKSIKNIIKRVLLTHSRHVGLLASCSRTLEVQKNFACTCEEILHGSVNIHLTSSISNSFILTISAPVWLKVDWGACQAADWPLS